MHSTTVDPAGTQERAFPFPIHEDATVDRIHDGLLSAQDAEEGEDVEPANILTAEGAETHLRILRHWRAERESVLEHARNERAKVEVWEKSELAKLERKIAWHESGLRTFLETTGRKTLKLIGGTLRKITGRDRVEVPDFERFKMWNDANGGAFVRIKMEPDKRAIAEHIKAVGEIPEGCDLVRGESSFKVDVE